MTVEAAQPHLPRSRCQLSYADFEAQCRHLCSVLPHTLSWHPAPSPFHSDGGYMAATNQLLAAPTSPPPSLLPLFDDTDREGLPHIPPLDSEEADVSSAEEETRAIIASYHSLYSSTYRVPVLLFRMSFADGQPLSMEETLATLQRLRDGRSRSLAQQCQASESEGGMAQDFPPLSAVLHPSLSSPFFSLHPCQTSSVMAALQATDAIESPSALSVLAWLSAIGPFAGFRLPFTAALQADITRRGEGNKSASGEGVMGAMQCTDGVE